jgi:hypothetical protein
MRTAHQAVRVRSSEVMLRWDSYPAVYGAELRAAAREYSDHGWPVVEAGSAGLLLATGSALDVLEVTAAVGRRACARLRAAGLAVPVAATPTGTWWFPVSPGAALPRALSGRPEVVLHADGAAILAPPSATPDGWVHWRVAPALSGYAPAPAGPVLAAVAAAVEETDELDNGFSRLERPDGRGAVAVAMRP